MVGEVRVVRWRWAIICALGVLAACSTRVNSTGPTASVTVLPRPNMIVVDNFLVDPSVVRVDGGLGGTARRIISGTSASDDQVQTATKVQAALRDRMIAAIFNMNLPVRSTDLGPASPPFVELRGTITSIDEGNQTRRNVIGLGAGKSSVEATAQLYYVAPNAPPVLLQSYQADANSGRMPGLVVGGAGAAAGHVAMAAANGGMKIASTGHADADADADRLTRDLADKVGAIFVQQGWIPASAPSAGMR
jgi:hypothetical protein